MDLDNYPERIKSLKKFEIFEQPKNEYKQVTRCMMKKGDMVTINVTKTKFSQINYKRFFSNAILSLPYGHPSLKEISDFKTEKGRKIGKIFWEEKEELSIVEKRALQETPRLQILDQKSGFNFISTKN